MYKFTLNMYLPSFVYLREFSGNLNGRELLVVFEHKKIFFPLLYEDSRYTSYDMTKNCGTFVRHTPVPKYY